MEGCEDDGVQKCDECKSQFKWRQIFLSQMVGGIKAIHCKKCGTKHEMAFSSTMLFIILMLLAFTTPGTVAYKKEVFDPVSTFLMTISILLPLTLILPYLLRYVSSDK